jgi:hypothetical protein
MIHPLPVAFSVHCDAGHMTLQVLPNGPSAISLIADEPPGAPLGMAEAATFDRASFHQGDKHEGLMPLAAGEQPSQGFAIALATQIDFGTDAALAAR